MLSYANFYSINLLAIFYRLPNDNYLYIYRISYMYYIVLGFIITFVVALLISAISPESNCDNLDLFTPFVAKRLRKHGSILKNNLVNMVFFFLTLIFIIKII